MKQAVVAIIFLAGFVGYWWWKSRGRALHEFLGLEPGEELKRYMTGRHAVALGVGDLGAAALGMQRVGKTITVAITQANALVIRTQGAAPLRPQPKQLQITRVKESVDKMSGAQGTSDVADEYEVQVSGTAPFRIVIARSCAEVMLAWTQS